jgi:MoxR-like ATPase
MQQQTKPAPLQSNLRSSLDSIIAQIGEIILGKNHQIKLAITCLLARGHLLIEDLPGVGKTTLAQTLAKALGLEFRRVQFTSDLLPADILGVSVYQRETGAFNFHPGPIFSQIILADEINRATPKTQSALLEAMEEGQVTIEGETRLLPEPFFVIATQNPRHQIGTFPLPESQLDRFLMKISLGTLDRDSERTLLEGEDRRELLARLRPRITPSELVALQRAVKTIHVSEALLDYLQELLEHSRAQPDLHTTLSPRAGLAVKHAAQAWAMLNGRSYVLPEDIQTVILPVASHRLQDRDHEPLSDSKLEELLIKAVPIP